MVALYSGVILCLRILQTYLKLHKFATTCTNSNFEKNDYYIKASSYQRTCTSIFSEIGLVCQSKPCTQIYLQKSQVA